MFVSVAGGERTRAREWSHLGAVVEDASVPPAALAGGLVHLTLHLNFQGYDIAVPARAKRDVSGEADPGPGLVRLEYVDLSPRSAELIEHFVEDFVRGRVVPAQDTLVRIDAPPEPISIKPDAAPAKRRRSFKPLLTSTFYLLLGLGVLGYLGVLFYANAVRLEVTSAVVTRPVQMIRPARDAVVAEVLRAVGDPVSAGDVIARLADPELDARVQRAEAVVATAEDATRRVRRRLAIEERKLEQYSLLEKAEERQAERDLRVARREWLRSVDRLREVVTLHDEKRRKGADDDSCEARLKPREQADLTLLRTMVPVADTLKTLRRKRLVPCFVLVDLYREQVRLRRAHDTALKGMADRTRLDEIADRRLFNGKQFVVDLDLAVLERDKAKAREREARAILAALESERADSVLRSPIAGRITALRVDANAAVTRGDVVALVENEAEPVIHAYLDQNEVSLLRLGDEADVHLPALGRDVATTISAIDRTAGFVDEQNARHTWRGPSDRSALVALRIRDEAFARTVPSGLPATVLFHRRSPSVLTEQALRDATTPLRKVVAPLQKVVAPLREALAPSPAAPTSDAASDPSRDPVTTASTDAVRDVPLDPWVEAHIARGNAVAAGPASTANSDPVSDPAPSARYAPTFGDMVADAHP